MENDRIIEFRKLQDRVLECLKTHWLLDLKPSEVAELLGVPTCDVRNVLGELEYEGRIKFTPNWKIVVIDSGR